MESAADARRTALAGETFEWIEYEFEFTAAIGLLSFATVRYANGMDA